MGRSTRPKAFPDKFRADLAVRDAERDSSFEKLRADFAELRADLAKESNANIKWHVGIQFAFWASAVTIIFLIVRAFAVFSCAV